ncbi:MAG: LysM peptidoglycan-binding domain-containing protein [Rhodospirillales bacterium]|nr:LysM peptidoglycan-binding domain-containing protein [Rhodospirillales bacterium]
MRDPATPGKIQVGDGDNLWSLSKRLGVSVDELRAANPDLNKNGDIRAGGYLNLPKTKEEKPQEQPQPQPEAAQQPTEPPLEAEPQPQQEQPKSTEPPLEAEPTQQKQSDLGADGQAFLERIRHPNARPALDVAAKEPQDWTKEEADTVIQHYQRYPRPESLNEWLRQQTSEHFNSRYGKADMIRDVTGRMVERTPQATTQPFMPDPDPKAMQKALEQIGGKLAPAFDADGLSGATKSMQQGLNLLNRDQMPRLKTDGGWGPITDFSFKKSLASHGTAKLDEGFALGRLQSLAEKPQQPEDLAKQTQNILGPLYGSQEQGDDHALALQAGLNRIGPKYQDDWQPLKLDGEIGPKTASAFNQLSRTAGPMALSEAIGSVLGWLE